MTDPHLGGQGALFCVSFGPFGVALSYWSGPVGPPNLPAGDPHVLTVLLQASSGKLEILSALLFLLLGPQAVAAGPGRELSATPFGPILVPI